MPLAVKDKVTEDDIKDNLINILSEKPTVEGVTLDPSTITVQGKPVNYVDILH